MKDEKIILYMLMTLRDYVYMRILKTDSHDLAYIKTELDRIISKLGEDDQ